LAISDEIDNKEKFTHDELKSNLKKNEALEAAL
jgi:hypothetical protein